MALTSNTTLDLVGQTSSIIFYQGASILDQITFQNNQITYSTISSYNLIQSDMALYYTYLNSWLSFLYQNFPIMNASQKAKWPFSEFEINEYSAGVTHIIYSQSSQGINFLNINYVPISGSGSVAARTVTTITPQEFIMGVNMKTNYFNQVALN